MERTRRKLGRNAVVFLVCTVFVLLSFDISLPRNTTLSLSVPKLDHNQTDIPHGKIQASHAIGADYLFWMGRNKICSLIQNITGVSKLGPSDPPQHTRQGSSQPPILNLTLKCSDMKDNTGNWITAIYHLRLVAAFGRVDFQFQCDDGMSMADYSILPWLSGYFPSNRSQWAFDLGWPESDRVCHKKYAKLPLEHLAHDMQNDMQALAVTILGPRSFNVTGDLRSRMEFLQGSIQRWQGHTDKETSIVYPREDIEIDDVALHFRCGDVFGGTSKDVYGLVKFKEFKDCIPNETTKSIGIFTQPFNVSHLRADDHDFVDQCEKLVGVLVEYLTKAYPNASISIRNTIEDTIPISYARMIMASRTITTMSTFGIFPAIGSFGDGYFKGSGRQNKFAHRVLEVLPNFHEMGNDKILTSPEIKRKSWSEIVNFLTSE